VDGSPVPAGVVEPVSECGASSATIASRSPDSRLGRRSSQHRQARVTNASVAGGCKFVGLDVSKERLDLHLRPSGEAFAVARDGEGLEVLSARLRALAPELVVLEATGGFEAVVAAALAAAALPLAIVNPAQVRAFGRATGRLANTDGLDAALIAHFAEAILPVPRPVASEQAQALAELVTLRRQVV
jgi:transposase